MLMKNKMKTSANEIVEDMLFLEGYVFCQNCGRSNAMKYDFHHIVYKSEARRHPELHNKRNLIHVCTGVDGAQGCHEWFHLKKENRNAIVEERRLHELFPEILIKS